MATAKAALGRPVLAILGAWGLLALPGCGGLKLAAVSGKVMLGDKPLTHGAVSFNPDASKGNTARVMCVGRINAQGRYELTTSGVRGSDTGKGAPLGWYKVTLISTLPGEAPIPVHSKYTDPDTTPLSIEVVANPAPDAYDLKVTK
jgi:hypothetical protein